jgi:DNA segregation ATPase FtsK/SpoIIIE, S-DNA-T family
VRLAVELILRVARAAAEPVDVIVDVEPSHTIADLTEALCRYVELPVTHVGMTVERTRATLEPATSAIDADLLSGDVIDLGRPGPRPARPRLPRRAVAADVLAGPESGRSQLLSPGTFRVGRQDDCDVVLDDPSVSRHHADIVVDETWTVSVVPAPGTPNGVTVNDDLIDAATAVEPDDIVGLGGTRLALRAFERSVDGHVDRLGQIEFHRTPYRPPVVTARDKVEVGPIPERPEPRRLQLIALLAPLIAGLAMFAFSKQIQFLALTLVSPIVMAANTVDDRRSGRVRFRDQLRRFRGEILEHRAELERLRQLERVERFRLAPDLADLARRAELRTVDLWARGRDSPDFLITRLGLGAAHVGYTVELQRGGAEDLREELQAALVGVEQLDNVPVTVDLREDAVLGIHGERDLVDGVAASLITQAAVLHSSDDLTIVVAVSPDRRLGWTKWLPHVRTVASPLAGNHVVVTHDEAIGVVARLVEIVEFRSTGDRADEEVRRWPRVLLVLDADLTPDAGEVSRLLDAAPGAGISVVWLARALGGVPRQASQVLEVSEGEGASMDGRLWSTDPDVAERRLEVEHLRPAVAERVARALSPVRDASTASQATSIPRVAPLLDVLGVGRPSAQWISEQWHRRTGYDLRFPIGVDAGGVLEIDLVEHGPHTLIGGTSGAGKSELLQSMVAALAARYPPTRLNLMFVDYKGGASSKVFEALPHTVGYVTNLSADLAARALTSLRAELNHRMRVMEGRAKDLATMLEEAPDDAPASLVIVVDEFATLVKEVPDFVAGVIDVAQRGRSLGIHLILATQRPSNINENILANTNLRISLRTIYRAESTSIVDSPAAAEIPVPLKGRGLARMGPRQLVEFQSAFSGAPLVSEAVAQPVLVGAYERTDDSPRAAAGAGRTPSASANGRDRVDVPTHLDVVIAAIVDAHQRLRLPAARRPWREVLPEVVTLQSVGSGAAAEVAGAQPGRLVVVGLLDSPETQDQRPLVVDLEEGGGWLVFGSGGSGKTTLLRTVAASISATSGGDDVAIVGFDFASRNLLSILPLPEVVDVATGDDLEAVTRHLATLDRELTRRRRLLADAGAEHLTAYNHTQQPLPRIVVLIDGFGAMAATFLNAAGSITSGSMDGWGEMIQRMVIEGRQVGIHTVIAADRHNAAPSRIHSAVGNRMVLRLADANAYAEHGISIERARHLVLPPGRGLWQGTTTVQLAVVSPDASSMAQGARLATFAERLGREKTGVLRSARLPESINLDQIDKPRGERLRPCLGVADITGQAVAVDLDWANLTVAGPPRSGRSTALATVAHSLHDGHELFVVGPPTSPLRAMVHDLPADRVAFDDAAAIGDLLDRLANLAAMGPGERPRVLLVDDADRLDDSTLQPLWTRLTGLGDLRLVAALETRAMSGYTTNPLLNVVRRATRLLVLRPDDPSEFLTATGVKLSIRPGIELVPGRGVLLVDRIPSIIHVARP